MMSFPNSKIFQTLGWTWSTIDSPRQLHLFVVHPQLCLYSLTPLSPSRLLLGGHFLSKFVCSFEKEEMGSMVIINFFCLFLVETEMSSNSALCEALAEMRACQKHRTLHSSIATNQCNVISGLLSVFLLLVISVFLRGALYRPSSITSRFPPSRPPLALPSPLVAGLAS